MSIDRVSNMLSMLKNASMAGNSCIETFHTKEVEGIAKVLAEKGFLSEVKTFKPKGKSFKMLHLDICYDDEICKISDVKRVSKPGHRRYVGADKLKKVAGGYGVQIVSTSRGIMDGEKAKNKKLGGEVLCEVY